MAPVTLPASEHESRIAEAPSDTACAMRCACTWPSSVGGVSHAISTGRPCFCDSSLAAASAPVRAARNTGLVELFAIIANLKPRAAGAALAAAALDPGAGACAGEHATPAASAGTATTAKSL